MANIIPKSLKKSKYSLPTARYDVTWWDLAVVGIYVVICVLIGVGLGFLPIVIRVLIPIMLFVCLLTTVFKSKKHGIRLYVLLFYKLIFLSKNKKFSANHSKNDTKLLVPYDKIVDNYIETMPLTGKITTLIGCVEIKGYNITLLSEMEQENRLEEVANLFKLVESSMSFLMINKQLDFDKHIEYYENLKEKIHRLLLNKKISKKGYDSRIEQINGYINFLQGNEDNSVLNYIINKRFYVFVYANSLLELKETMDNVIEKLTNANLGAVELNKYELVNIIKSIHNPYENDWSNEYIDKYKNNLDELLKISKITFAAEEIKLDGMHYAITGIRDYPLFPKNGWGSVLTKTDCTMIWNVSPLSKDKVNNDVDQAIINTESATYSVKKVVNRTEKEYQLSALRQLADNLASGDEVMKNVNVLFLHYGTDKAEIKESKKNLKKLLDENQMKIDYLPYRQFQAYSGILPKESDGVHSLGQPIPSNTLGGSFMWIKNTLEDENGLFLGFNRTNGVVMFDQFLRDGSRKNSNLFLIGTSGDGKSTFINKLANYRICLGDKVIIIDPERECKKLCDYHDGIWIDTGTGIRGRINPLQIIIGFETDNEIQTVSSVIADHITNLEPFFKFLLKDLNSEEIRYLSKSILTVYYMEGITDEDLDLEKLKKLRNDQYPTIENLVTLLEKHKNKGFMEERVWKIIKYEFTGHGKYATLWNGHSDLKFDNNLLYVFDIKTLFDKNPIVAAAQMYLVTRLIFNEVNKNRFGQKNRIWVMVDEAHILIDKNNPEGLMMMFRLFKMIRKYYGAMSVVTQNIGDFTAVEEVKRETTTIINNAQYVGIMGLKENDLKEVQELYRASGGLTEQELKFINKAKVGELLFNVSGQDRHTLKLEYSQTEKELLWVKQNIDN